MIQKNDWIKYFPFETPRNEQIEAINFILNSFVNLNKKFILCELPTGVGKSAIAITVSKYFSENNNDKYNASYIITTQRILQEQYVNDYNIPKIWSKNNYFCKNRYNISCQFGSWVNKIAKNINYCECIYDKEKKIFFDSDISITNIPYMFNYIEYNINDLQRRKLLVVDECHNLEAEVVEFVSIEIDKYFLENYNIKWNISNDIEIIFDWMSNTIYSILLDKKNEFLLTIKSYGKELLIVAEGKNLIKKYDELDRYLSKLDRVIQKFKNNEWVLSRNLENDSITLKPIFASNFTNDLLFNKISNKFLLMSSTILNKNTFCNNIGIDINDCEFISLQSPFSIDNRPVMFVPVASMSYKNIKESLPKMIKPINDIINSYHKKDKGIIHCSTYNIAEYLYRNIKNKRLLIHNSDNRIEVLNTHLNSSEPTILLSPSLTEGIDLIDNLSRFQILVKIPFPYLGDNYILTKMKKIKNWYEWNTVKTLIQSSGRSVRTHSDYAYTYILDSDFDFFYKKNEFLFPEWFKNAIIKI